VTDPLEGPEDTTPLTPEEREGLLPRWIAHRAELNEAEQQNILHGLAWVRRRRGRRPAHVLTVDFVRALHKRMFGDVWNWAGAYRTTARNIGVDAYRIPQETAALLEDVRYWVECDTYPPDEIAVRLHHRLVAIHPFPNGNGRHARLMADILVERLGRQPFSWGAGSLMEIGELRTRYISALRAADNHDIAPLLDFARS
jgi:Fic-DOC domain mobile mystery protein B